MLAKGETDGMSFIDAINLAAAFVTIIGGGISIARTLTKSPSRSASETSAPASPAPSPMTAGAPSGAPQRRSAPTSGLRTGLVWGMLLGVPMTVVSLGGIGAASGTSAEGTANLIGFSSLGAMAVLSIVGGLLPVRRTGLVTSGLVAGLILALVVAGTLAYFGDGTLTRVLLPAAYGAVALVLSCLAAAIGLWAYRRAARASAPIASSAR